MAQRKTLNFYLPRVYGLLCVNSIVLCLVYLYTSSNKVKLIKAPDEMCSREASQSNILSTLNRKDAIQQNYIQYTCFEIRSKLPKNKNNKSCVRILDLKQTSQLISEDSCIRLRLHNISTPICIHDPRKDRVISASIFIYGSWERKLVSDLLKYLHKHSNITFLDIGCNLGTYTLAVASQGIPAIAVDANIENMALLSKAVVLGNLTRFVTPVWNAVSNKYKTMFVKERKFNIGGQKVQELAASTNNTSKSIIESIRLDDLLYLFNNTKVAIKMDVEDHELEVLEGGTEFLNHVDVRLIQMEILFHKQKKSGQKIVNLLKLKGFVAFSNCHGNGLLAFKTITEWPDDVCFIKI